MPTRAELGEPIATLVFSRSMRTLFVVASLLIAVFAVAGDVTYGTKSSAKKDYYTVKSKFPILPDSHPLAKVANSELKSWVTKRHTEFLKQIRQDLAELKEKPTSEWFQDIEPTVVYQSPRLYSVRIHIEVDTGGAHPGYVEYTFNYGVVDGKAKKLKLADFFTSKSGYKKRVNDLLMGKLKQNEGAMWVTEGTVKDINDEQFQRFVIKPTGLLFIFNPYEMGPWSSGNFEIQLSIHEMGDSFKKALLLAR